ncbi:hypothetical protein M426DRAFT_66005 [Hypoxylon sp. CI-4A]|nr:hypothetical protein M426DRAFT_66005 [Hypoxylon sp. CI-4A]
MSPGYHGHGFIGYGISMYKPSCAFACHDALSQYQLTCSAVMDHPMFGHRMGRPGQNFMTEPDCYASDDNFLRSVAYCIGTHCSDVSVPDLEHYWETYLVGRDPGQPKPKEPYSVALVHADPAPDVVVNFTSVLNTTTLVSEEFYLESYASNSLFEQLETTQSTFGLIVLITGAAIPIACSLLRFVPFPRAITNRFRAYFIDPPLFGRRHRTPFLNLAIIPTRGQAFLIAYLILINIVLSCVGYRLTMPGVEEEPGRLLSSITNRMGVLSLANLALLVLYAGRNNILLSITNWSYSTFLLVHRWVAIICTIEACLHGSLYLHIYLGRGYFPIESKLAYWIWGVIAVLSFSILLPTSILPIRQRVYNLFVTFHFAFAFLAMIGCYFHIFNRFQHQWGYETWVYIAFGFWAFDRLMRFARLAQNGVRMAEITVVDENYIRVDIPGVTAQGHAYLYFPTLSWRMWENHPFSVIGAMMIQTPSKTPSSTTTREDISTSAIDIEKAPVRASAPVPFYSRGTFSGQGEDVSFRPGLTFFVTTTGSGLTSKLHHKTRLPVLVEAPYAASSLDELRSIPNCIVVAGGVGITALAPLLRTRGTGRVRLYWGVRSQALVEAAKASLGPDVLVPSIVGDIAVGRRLDLRSILEGEVCGEGETAVVVCGPVGMADEVREIVCELGRKGRAVKLVDEAFSW